MDLFYSIIIQENINIVIILINILRLFCRIAGGKIKKITVIPVGKETAERSKNGKV